MKEKVFKNENGITLIALVITIIVMLILVAVTITIAVNGGLFGYAGNAVKDTELAKQDEQKIAGGYIEVDGKKYDSPDDYIIGKESDSEKFSSIYISTDENFKDPDGVPAVIPKGFAVGTSEGINKVADGLVIQDEKGNQFVWIPVPGKNMQVATTNNTYANSYYQEPIELNNYDSSLRSKYDSQQELDYYYGTGFFTYPNSVSDEENATDFSYGVHYKEMATSINKYGGFYIGRYETTIDNSYKIGSKANTTVLLSNQKINGTDNYYRWWGLYSVQRHANISENGNTVQTNMIWGQQWDKMITYFDSQEIDYSQIDPTIYNKPETIQKSGQATFTNKNDDKDVIKDKIFNIYDLRENALDWTAEANYTADTFGRVLRGSWGAHRGFSWPNNSFSDYRLTFNIIY